MKRLFDFFGATRVKTRTSSFGARPSTKLGLVVGAMALFMACSEKAPPEGAPPEGPTIGNPVGQSIPITHEVAHATAERNLRDHFDSLNSSMTFLNKSDSLDNVLSMLREDESGEDEPGEDEPSEDEPSEDESSGDAIDLSELRDAALELMVQDIMRKEAAALSSDGLTLTYAIDPEMFCVEDDVDPDESDEAREERLTEEAECTDRIAAHELRLIATSDAPGDLNLELQHGKDGTSALRAQLHDDVIAVFISLPQLKSLIEVFVSPEDFELPKTMKGQLAAEVRRHNPLMYGMRVAIVEAIDVTSAPGQDGYSLKIPASDEAGVITIDGAAASLSGAVHVDGVDASVPWQMVVDMFYDEEGHSESQCEPNPQTGDEECHDVWVDPPEAPSVDQTLFVSIPGIHGELSYTLATDEFRFAGLNLGGATTTVRVDDDRIIGFDLNPDDGRSLGLTVRETKSGDMELALSPSLDARITFAWKHVKEAFEELPDVLLDDTIGIRMNGSDAPALRMLDTGDDIEIQVASGKLTLWSVNMSEDVVIEAGQCIESIDDSMLTDEEREAQHDLFGNLNGGTCGG